MSLVLPDAILIAAVSIFVFLVLSAALALVLVSIRRPTTAPLAVAAGLVAVALLVIVISPVNVPLPVGLVIALLGTVLAVVGGDPFTRRILDVATHGRVRDGDNGGILLTDSREQDAAEPAAEVMRGGATIGYLERFAVAVSLFTGFPEAIAVVVAVKGVGRFAELDSAEARERFIIGTLASLIWACVVGALVRLAIW